ncbi:cupin domain-containing protein [Halolamina sp. C58]|uniref:cupin domain-containing protein n=1 Tax=Halolamina sp. C58 TaxID=3421640 RepID=UPI003EC14FCE
MQTFVSDGSPSESLSDALGTTDVAINRYRLSPGEGLPSGLHTHLDQEEVFYVIEGTVTFDTLSEPVAVDAGEAVRFAPGEYQTGANTGESPAVVLAIGAPRESEQVRVPLDCPDCGHRGLSPEFDGELRLACPDCGGEHRTRGCPACGNAEMEVASGEGEGETIVVCPDCGAERSEPRWA